MDESPRWRVARTIRTAHGPALQWRLQRHCALTPRQFACTGLAMPVAALAAGAVFWALGYALVAWFALLQLALVVAALLSHARHACDGDTLTLDRETLVVRQRRGPVVRRRRLQVPWVRIEGGRDHGAPLVLRQGRLRVCVGAEVQPALRDVVARELQQALQMARMQQALKPPAAPAGAGVVP